MASCGGLVTRLLAVVRSRPSRLTIGRRLNNLPHKSARQTISLSDASRIVVDMIEKMKRLGLLVLFCGTWLCAADLTTVRSVYILPMRNGLDQYLANRLTNGGVFRIVTDPALADAVLTDHIGAAFESQLEDMSPKPEPVKKVELPPPAPKKKEDATKPTPLIDTDTKAHDLPKTSTFGRTSGAIFLVDEKSRQVLWSVFDPPKGSESKEMDRTASDIVSRIKKDLAPGK
jgi:hypothetical protein